MGILWAQRRREGERAEESVAAGGRLAPATSAAAIMRLQRTVGNAAVARLLGPGGGVGELPYRSELETAFGEDFSSVRVSFGRGAELARLGAKAFARGEQLEFASRAPSKELVAHELAHVVQNRSASSRPARLLSTLSRSSDAAEREADDAAARARRGQRITIRAAPSAVVQLCKFKVGDRVRLNPFDERIVQIVGIRDKRDKPGHIYAVKAGGGERFNVTGKEIAGPAAKQVGADAMTGDPADKHELPITSRRAYNESLSMKLVQSSAAAEEYVRERYRARTFDGKENSNLGEGRFQELMKLSGKTGGEYWRLVTDPGLMAGLYFTDFVAFVAKKTDNEALRESFTQPWVMRDWFSHDFGTVEWYRGFGMSEEEVDAAMSTGLLPAVSLAARAGQNPDTAELDSMSILDVITNRIFRMGGVGALPGSQSVTRFSELAGAVAHRVLREERSRASPEKVDALAEKRVYVFKVRLPKLDVIDPGPIRQDIGRHQVVLGGARYDSGGGTESIVIGNIGNLEIESVERWEETHLQVVCEHRGGGGGGLRMKRPV